jgi:hypothetical protein
MLAGLRETNHRRLVGVELDEKKILTGISRGLDVIRERKVAREPISLQILPETRAREGAGPSGLGY